MKRVKKCLLLSVVIISLLITGCSSSDNDKKTESKTHIITDSIGREVELPNPVTKSVVANAYNVEIINGIGKIDSIVGVDNNIYENNEAWKGKFTEEQVIGKNQKELNYEKIIELKPEVLILTGNGVYEEAIEQLDPFGIKVLVVDAYYTDQFEQNCDILGKVFGSEDKAKELSSYFTDKLDYIDKQLKDVAKKKVYFEYRRIGNTTVPGDFFYNMVEFAHADNIFKDAKDVEVDPEAIIVENPDYIVKVSDVDVQSTYIPPTIQDHKAIHDELINRPGWDEINAVKDDNILLLSHYVHGGASKLVGTMYIAKYLYPDQLPELNPEEVFKDWLKFQSLDYIKGHTYPQYGLNKN